MQRHGTKFDITIHTARQHELSEHMIEKPKKDLSKVIQSPMPGSVVSISVNVGDMVGIYILAHACDTVTLLILDVLF